MPRTIIYAPKRLDKVERLARMIKQQAEQAQFIVVSFRRPMIESARRTIGITQAGGAYTQVLGIKLGDREQGTGNRKEVYQ
jgi:chromosome segregation protein